MFITKNNVKLGAGFVLTSISFILTIVGFILYFTAINAMEYEADRFVIALTIMALWSLIFLIVNSLFKNDNPFWTSIFYIVITFTLFLGFSFFLSSFLSPIGVYFTVNMGDMEKYALGVPRCLAGVACYVLAIITNVVSSFFKPFVMEKGAQHE